LNYVVKKNVKDIFNIDTFQQELIFPRRGKWQKSIILYLIGDKLQESRYFPVNRVLQNMKNMLLILTQQSWAANVMLYKITLISIWLPHRWEKCKKAKTDEDIIKLARLQNATGIRRLNINRYYKKVCNYQCANIFL